MAVAMTQAWTWMPCACALSMSVWSGSNGAGVTPSCSMRAAEERLQRQSPRRTTCATIAFALIAFVAAMTSSICAAVYIPSPNASTQYARNSPPAWGTAGCALVPSETSKGAAVAICAVGSTAATNSSAAQSATTTFLTDRSTRAQVCSVRTGAREASDRAKISAPWRATCPFLDSPCRDAPISLRRDCAMGRWWHALARVRATGRGAGLRRPPRDRPHGRSARADPSDDGRRRRDGKTPRRLVRLLERLSQHRDARKRDHDDRCDLRGPSRARHRRGVGGARLP